MSTTGIEIATSDAVSRLFAKIAYDVQVTYATNLRIPRGRQLAHIKAFIGGRCRIRTCDFHRVKVALYR